MKPNPYESPKENGGIESRPWFDTLTIIVGGIASLITLLILAVFSLAFIAELAQ